MQRRLAWPLRKDGAHKSRSVPIFTTSASPGCLACHLAAAFPWPNTTSPTATTTAARQQQQQRRANNTSSSTSTEVYQTATLQRTTHRGTAPRQHNTHQHTTAQHHNTATHNSRTHCNASRRIAIRSLPSLSHYLPFSVILSGGFHVTQRPNV